MNISYINMEESFMEITGCETTEEAHKWLQMTNNDLDESVGLFFTSKDDLIDVSQNKQENNLSSPCKRSYENEDEIRVPDETKREKLIDSDLDIFSF